jgi:hypothetical protein
MSKLDELLGMTDDEANAMTNDTDNDTQGEAGDDVGDPAAEAPKMSLEQLEALQRENAGLLKGIKEERKKRQEFQSRLDVLTGTVNAILEKRAAGNTKSDADSTGAVKKPAIILDIDDDGETVLPVDKLDAVLAPYREEIENLKGMIAAGYQQTQKQAAGNAVLQKTLSEDERFSKIYNNEYTKARTWANERVIEWQKDNNYQGQLNGELAMEYVFDGELEKEFQKAFPGADLEAVVGQSNRSLRRALRSFIPKDEEAATTVASAIPAKGKESASRFQKVLNKPSGLSGARNAKAAQLDVVDKVGALSATDLLDMSDAEAAAILEAMSSEERTSGIKF